MKVEEKIKQVLGEQMFNIIVLSAQLEEAQKKISEHEKSAPSASAAS